MVVEMTKEPLRTKGKETKATILRSAKDLLLDEGYGNFVFRRVAKRAGVEPGNVQYYFARKRDLLWAVLKPELENYQARLENAVKSGHTKEEKIARMVRYLIGDVTKEDTLRLWLSIWGMAAHDEEISEIVSVFYRSYIETLSKLLQEVFPSLDTDRANEAATAITAQFDGLLVVLLIGKPKRKTVANIKRNIDAIITRIIDVDRSY